jgi:glycosyltransferase involved in cell wall biosynthesis
MQPFTDYEILVVDDGSTDQSMDRVKEFEFEHIRCFSKANGGPASARNFGVRNAMGR